MQIPNLSDDLYRKLSLCLNIQQFEENKYVYQIGEKAQFFYLILKGSVSVLMPSNKDYDDEESLIFNEIYRLSQGKAFGEYSLIYNQER